MKHIYMTQIIERHLDTFGHVNNATYVSMFEEARWDWITKNGFGYDQIQKTQTGPVTLDLKIKFKRELHNREKVIIETCVPASEGRLCQAHQVIYKENGQVSAEAVFTVGFFDLKNRKLISPSEGWLKALAFSAVEENRVAKAS